jgi:hypothetical protein
MSIAAAKLFTTVISSGVGNIYTIDPTLTGARQVAILWISGSPTVRGNLSAIKVYDSNNAEYTLNDSVITLSTSNNIVNLVTNGVDARKVTIDCSAGSVALLVDS